MSQMSKGNNVSSSVFCGLEQRERRANCVILPGFEHPLLEWLKMSLAAAPGFMKQR